MANDKNNTNKLVAEDDDPTAELEMLADTYDFVGRKRKEVAPSISELESDLKNRSETIDRLQFDIEHLRAKWAGLEVEIKAREDLTKDLNQELGNARDNLVLKEKLLKRRDQQIERLKKERREDRETESEAEQLIDQRQSGKLASSRTEVRELRAQLKRMESYADDLRQKLQERLSLTDRAESTREILQHSLDRTTQQVEQLEGELEQARASSKSLADELLSSSELHAEEIRMIRFELGEAQETVTDTNSLPNNSHPTSLIRANFATASNAR